MTRTVTVKQHDPLWAFIWAGVSLVLFVALIFVAGAGELNPPKPVTKVVYRDSGKRLPHSVVNVYQAGTLVVRCETRTNSIPFANRVKAKVGDVVQTTCRAEKPADTPTGPGA